MKKDLVQNGEPLKLFLYTIQGGPAPINIAEDFHAVTAYTEQEAIDTLKTKYPAGHVLHLRTRGNIAIQQILDVVNLPHAPKPLFAQPEVTEEREYNPPKSAEQFVASLMLVMDLFIPERVDQEIIKGILAKVNLYDPTANGGEAKEEGKPRGRKKSSSNSDGSSAGTKGTN